MEMKIEVVFLPVSDVDRAKAFYVDQLGFNPDHDHQVSDELRFVQLTPPGSACSICIGTGLVDNSAPPIENIMMVVADADLALAELRARGVDASGVDEQAWGRFVAFKDPDGNGWTLQQLPDWAGAN